MFPKDTIFNHAFKRQNFIYYSGVVLSNVFMYAMLCMFLQFHLASDVPIALIWGAVVLQWVIWTVLKAIDVTEDDSQLLQSQKFVVGGLVGMVLAVVGLYLLGVHQPYVIAIVTILHIFFQRVFWTELSTSSPSDKKFFSARVVAMALMTYTVFLTNIHDPQLMVICGIFWLLHIFTRSVVTAASQIWLVYNEEVIYKSHYHQIVKINQVQHRAANMRTSIKEGILNNLKFVTLTALGSLVVMGTLSLGVVKQAYVTLVNVLMGLVHFFLGDLIQAILDFMVGRQKLLQPVLIKKGAAGSGVAKMQSTYNDTQREGAMQILSVVGIGLVAALILYILYAMSQSHLEKVRRQIRTNEDLGRSRHEGIPIFESFKRVTDLKALFQRSQIDPFRKKYQKLMVLLKTLGIVVEHSDTPLELAEKMICYLPGERSNVELVTTVYNELRYGDIHSSRYEEALVSVDRLIKTTKKEVRQFGKKV